MIEGTNVSVGRGTDAPFEVVGAPVDEGAGISRVLECPQHSECALRADGFYSVIE